MSLFQWVSHRWPSYLASPLAQKIEGKQKELLALALRLPKSPLPLNEPPTNVLHFIFTAYEVFTAWSLLSGLRS